MLICLWCFGCASLCSFSGAILGVILHIHNIKCNGAISLPIWVTSPYKPLPLPIYSITVLIISCEYTWNCVSYSVCLFSNHTLQKLMNERKSCCVHPLFAFLFFLPYALLCVVVQSHPALCNPWTVARQVPLSMGILQARILEWVAMPSFRGSSQPRDRIQVSCIADGSFTIWVTREAQEYWSG